MCLCNKSIFYSGKLEFPYFDNKCLIEEEKILTVFYTNNSYKFTENHTLFDNLKENLEKKEFSKYFDEYFQYDIGDNSKTFSYYE